MATTLHGICQTENEAVESIEKLKAQGTRSSDISVVLNSEEQGTFMAQETEVNVHIEENHKPTNQKHGFMENVKEAFSGTSRDEQKENHVKETLIRLGLEENEAPLYIDDVESGKIVVLIHADSPYTAEPSTKSTTQVPDTISHNTAFPPGNSSAVNNETPPSTLDQDREETTSEEEQALQLREETLDVSKKKVDRGEVGVTKEVVEDEKTVSVPVQREEGYIEKRPVNSNDYESTEEIKESSEHIQMPLTDEEVDVKKRTIVTDEVIVGKRKYEETQEKTEQVKREETRIQGEENLQRDDKENETSDDASLNPLQNKRKDQ